MSQCFISSNQESLISSKLLTKQQEEKRKGRENVNRDYRYLLLLVRKEDSAWCVFFYSCVFIKFKLSTKSEWKIYCCCARLLCIFIWYSPINVATIHSSSLLQFQWTASSDLSNHSLSLSPIRAAASVPMCQCGQTVICPRGQIIRIIVPVQISWSFWRFKMPIYGWLQQ